MMVNSLRKNFVQLRENSFLSRVATFLEGLSKRKSQFVKFVRKIHEVYWSIDLYKRLCSQSVEGFILPKLLQICTSILCIKYCLFLFKNNLKDPDPSNKNNLKDLDPSNKKSQRSRSIQQK